MDTYLCIRLEPGSIHAEIGGSAVVKDAAGVEHRVVKAMAFDMPEDMIASLRAAMQKAVPTLEGALQRSVAVHLSAVNTGIEAKGKGLVGTLTGLFGGGGSK